MNETFSVAGTNAHRVDGIEKVTGKAIYTTDIQLPGMDGLEATVLLKRDAATRAIPVIALTALAMKGDEGRIRAAGCDGYIAKPLVYREFLAVIAEHCKVSP